MRMLTLILAVMTSSLLIMAQEKLKDQTSAKKIKELQEKRIATLMELMELVDDAATRFKNSQASHEEVLEAQINLFQAKLDAAEKMSERIALYKNIIDELNRSEELAKERHRTGQGTAGAILKIRARRLEVEIALEQEKMKQAKESK